MANVVVAKDAVADTDAATILDDMIMQDWLLKKSPHRLKNYQKRWVRLSTQKLCYFDGRQQLCGEIPIGMLSEVQQMYRPKSNSIGASLKSSVPGQRRSHKGCAYFDPTRIEPDEHFVLRSGHKEWLWKATSADAATQWVRAIKIPLEAYRKRVGSTPAALRPSSGGVDAKWWKAASRQRASTNTGTSASATIWNNPVCRRHTSKSCQSLAASPARSGVEARELNPGPGQGQGQGQGHIGLTSRHDGKETAAANASGTFQFLGPAASRESELIAAAARTYSAQLEPYHIEGLSGIAAGRGSISTGQNVENEFGNGDSDVVAGVDDLCTVTGTDAASLTASTNTSGSDVDSPDSLGCRSSSSSSNASDGRISAANQGGAGCFAHSGPGVSSRARHPSRQLQRRISLEVDDFLANLGLRPRTDSGQERPARSSRALTVTSSDSISNTHSQHKTMSATKMEEIPIAQTPRLSELTADGGASSSAASGRLVARPVTVTSTTSSMPLMPSFAPSTAKHPDPSLQPSHRPKRRHSLDSGVAAQCAARSQSSMTPVAGTAADLGQVLPRDHQARLTANSRRHSRVLPALAFLAAQPLVDRRTRPPTAVEQLDIEAEHELIWSAMGEVGRKLALTVEIGASTDTLRRTVTLARSTGCRAIHFAGHACPDFIALESALGIGCGGGAGGGNGRGGCGDVHWLAAAQLRELFSAGAGHVGQAPPIQFVFVSACQSQGAGQAFVQAGVPHVVASRAPVMDKAAHLFCRQLYLALFDGQTVQASFDAALSFVKATLPHHPPPADGGELFVILPEGADHRATIFGKEIAVRGLPLHRAPKLPDAPAFCADVKFVGRQLEMAEVCKIMSRGRSCAKLRGPAGIGKTCLALKVCEYLWPRGVFGAGIFLARIHQNSSEHKSTNGLSQPTESQKLAALIARALSLGNYVKTESELVSAARRKFAGHESRDGRRAERALLIIDGCELAADAAALRRIIASLMDSAPSLSLLLTQATPESSSRGPDRSVDVLHHSEKLVQVGPLSDLEAAKLFVSVASRKEALQIPEMTAYGCAGEHTVVAFSKHPVIRLQRGNPGRIVKNAPKLQERTLTELTKLLQFEDTLAVMETKGLHRSSSRKAMRMSRLSASIIAPMLAKGPGEIE